MKPTIQSLLLALCLFLTLSPAQAQIVVWNGGNGLWSTNSNWSGNLAPTNTETALIDVQSSITLPSTPTVVAGVDIHSAAISITSTSASFSTGVLFSSGGATFTLIIPTGDQFNVTSAGSAIGDNVGNGSTILTGDGTLNYSGVGWTFIGEGATGNLTQSAGTVLVQSGAGTGTLVIGSDGAVGGALPETSPGTGVYTISGTSTLTADHIQLGVGSSPTAAKSVGTLQINGGNVNALEIDMGVSAPNPIGTVNGDTGVIAQSGGTLTTQLLNIGDSTGGVGSYTLSGGALSGATINIGDQAGASGTLTISGAGTGTATTLEVGNGGTGIFTNSGTMTILTGGGVIVGDQAGSVGTVNQNAGLLDIQGTSGLTIGNSGTGSFIQQGGTVNVGGALAVGTGPSVGSYTLSGGTLNANGGIFVGGGGSTGTFNDNSGGTLNYTGGITVLNGGTFNQGANIAPTTADTITLGAGAIYNLNSGTLTVGGNMSNAGFSGISADPNAIFNFAGGSVANDGINGTWVDSLAGSVTGNTTIDTTAGNATLSGSLTGGGKFTLIGGGLLDITGVNSSSQLWSVEASNGTISADASTFPSAGNITIDSTGIVDMGMGTAGTHVLTGNVTSAAGGAFNVTFLGNTDVLELTGNTQLAGVTDFVSGNGTLEVANGSLAQITGAGGMTIGGTASTGSVNFTSAANNYTGPTTINSGYTLTANSILGTGLVTNNGTLGANAATFNIGGSLVSNGTLLIDMHHSTNPDVIHVAGSADLTNSSYTLLNAAAVSGTFTVLTTTGALTATTDTLSSNVFVQAVITDTITPKVLDLVTTTTTSAQIAGLVLTPNEQAAAQAIDPFIGNTSLTPGQQQNVSVLLNLIGTTDLTQLAKNYEQLTPESLQYAQDIAYEHSAFLVSKVDGFDDALHHEFAGFDTGGISIALPGFDSAMGRQMQSMLAYDPSGWHPTAPNGVNYYPDDGSGVSSPAPASPEPGQVMSDSPTTAPMPVRTEPHSVVLRKPYSNFSAFVGGDGTIADLNQDQGASYAPSSKASYSAVDAIAGISYRMTSNLAAGVLFDYSHTDATTDGYGSKTKVDSYTPGVFATYGDKGFFINGLFAYGRNNYSNNRAIPVIGGIANSNPDGNQYTAALDAGYDLHLGESLTVTPSGGLTYTHLDIDSFTETGAAPANLSVDAQHDDSLRSRLGASVSYLTGIGRLTLIPTLSAMWQHEFLDENAPITSSFNDFSSGAFTIHSVSMGRDSALIGVGLTAQLDNSMAIFFEASADVNNDYNAENFIGGFKGSF